MKEKKASADWYIAATHWLTSGFVIPLILGFVAIMVLAAIIGSGASANTFTVSVAIIILTPIFFWLGVMYSAKYLDKTYVIKNAQNIVLLSTVYLVVIGGGYRLYQFLQTGIFKDEYIGFILGLLAFYLASKKYIKNNA